MSAALVELCAMVAFCAWQWLLWFSPSARRREERNEAQRRAAEVESEARWRLAVEAEMKRLRGER